MSLRSGKAPRRTRQEKQMIVEAHAKINWSLDITGRRGDGYHLVDMILQRISLCDTLEVLPSEDLSLALDPESSFSAPPDGSNLILRAARALRERAGENRGASFILKKRIPSGAGLGGGSADAAAALLALNRLWGLDLPLNELEALSLPLGADIPFCLHREAMRVTGIGEILSPLPALPERHLVLLKGPEGLDTGSVYRRYDQSAVPSAYRHERAAAALMSPRADLKSALTNVLEPPACSLCPRIRADIGRLYSAGASFAQMTGSGSAVYGVFEDENRAGAACLSLKEAVPECVCIAASTI